MSDRLSELEFMVRGLVRKATEGSGVRVKYAKPRRESDITLVFLRGEREKVLELPPRISAELVFYDLEPIRSRMDEENGYFELLMAVTMKLEDQALHFPERRSKLYRFLPPHLSVVQERITLVRDPDPEEVE